MSGTGDQRDGVLAEADRGRVLDQLDIWRKQLINLARSNRLLYFRHTRTSTVEIVDEPANLAVIVADLLAGRARRFYMPPESESVEAGAAEEPTPDERLTLWTQDAAVREAAANQLVTSKKTARELRNSLRTLDRRATQEFMDKGIWILYLAVGMLRWTDPDNREQAESPLVLLPVQLRRESVNADRNQERAPVENGSTSVRS